MKEIDLGWDKFLAPPLNLPMISFLQVLMGHAPPPPDRILYHEPTWVNRINTFHGILRNLTDIVPCSLCFSPLQALLTEGGGVTYERQVPNGSFTAETEFKIHRDRDREKKTQQLILYSTRPPVLHSTRTLIHKRWIRKIDAFVLCVWLWRDSSYLGWLFSLCVEWLLCVGRS